MTDIARKRKMSLTKALNIITLIQFESTHLFLTFKDQFLMSLVSCLMSRSAWRSWSHIWDATHTVYLTCKAVDHFRLPVVASKAMVLNMALSFKHNLQTACTLQMKLHTFLIEGSLNRVECSLSFGESSTQVGVDSLVTSLVINLVFSYLSQTSSLSRYRWKHKANAVAALPIAGIGPRVWCALSS